MAALAVVTAAGSAPASAAHAAHTTLTGVGIIDLGGTLAELPQARSAGMVVGPTDEASTLARLPGLSLVYFTAPDVNVDWNAGVTYAQARAHGWLLRGADGSLLVNQGYPDDYVGDVGARGYQRAWLANVLGFLHGHPGIRGVMIDDVLYDLVPLAGEEAAAYPTQAAWARAQLSFIAAVGPALRSRGYYVLVNASGYVPGDPASVGGASEVAWWRDLAPYVSGLMCENWLETANMTGTLRSAGTETWMQYWGGWQNLVAVAQSLGRDFVGEMYGPSEDTAAMGYGEASFLLDWDGRGGAFAYVALDGSQTWNPAWTTSVGTPAAAKRRVGNGWMRRYTHGIALVDPSPSAAQRFELPGPYRAPSGGGALTSITLQPTTGVVLRAAGAAR